MAVFEYRGVFVVSGKAAKGVRDAENQKALRAILRKDGILITNAVEVDPRAALKVGGAFDWRSLLMRVTAKDVGLMTELLATLVGAGTPLFEALGTLVEQVEKEPLRKALTSIREQVKEGSSFAKALEQHPQLFPDLYVSMVRAGEASGTLQQVLRSLATYLDSQSQLRSKVQSAMAYPILMSMVATTVIGLLMTFVVPRMTQVFESMGAALPLPTLILIKVSGFLASFWWLIVAVLVGGAWWFRRWISTPAGRLSFDERALKAPLFGALISRVAVARMARTLATLLKSGVTLLMALEIAKKLLGNVVLEKVIADAIVQVREGQGLAITLKRSGKFQPMVIHMIQTGESSGQLEHMLESLATSYEADVQVQVTTMTSLLEPLIMLVMGVSVAFIALSIMMPLFQMSGFGQ